MLEIPIAMTYTRAQILDNVAFHKSKRAEELVRERGAWLLFLPRYAIIVQRGGKLAQR